MRKVERSSVQRIVLHRRRISLMGQCCDCLCNRRGNSTTESVHPLILPEQNLGVDNTPPVQVPRPEPRPTDYGATSKQLETGLSGSMKHFGRTAYTFDGPLVHYDKEPEYLISTFQDNSFIAAQSIVDLFQQSLNVCKEVKKAIDDCMKLVGLPPDAPLPTCFEQIKLKYNVNVVVDDTQPPKIRIISVLVPPEVKSACEKLNNALKLSSLFTNDEKHTRLEQDRLLVSTFENETALLQKAVHELKKYETFIVSVKKQTDCFISDFLYCFN